MTSRQRRAARGAPPARAFVDSGAWLALRSRRDQHHLEADALFRDALGWRIPLVTTNLVMAETHRLTLFQHADVVYRLQDGRLIEHPHARPLVGRGREQSV